MVLDDDDVSTLLSSAMLVTVGQILYSVSHLFERVLVARTLSPDAYGEVSIGLSVMGIGATMALIGFNQGVPRYIARFDSVTDRRGVWVTGLLLTTVSAVALSGTLFFNIEGITAVLVREGASPRLLQLFVLAIPLIVWLRVGVGAIRGYENTVYRTYTRDLFYPIVRIAVLFVLLTWGFGVYAAGYAYLVAAALTVFLVHVLLNRLVPLAGSFNLHAKEMLVFSAPLIISTMMSVLLGRMDTLMVGYFKTPYDVGLYSAAFPLANGMALVLGAFGFMYLPVTSRLDAGGKREEVDAVYSLTTKWIFIITFPLLLTFISFPDDVITAVFGGEYSAAAGALVILSLGFFSHAAAGRSRETLSALGVTTYVLVATGTGFVLNLVLNLLLIPEFSYFGAAVASASSYIGMNLLTIGILKWQFDITPFSRWSIRTFVALPLCLLPPAIVLSRVVALSTPLLGVFLIGSAALTLVVVGLTGCLQPEDGIILDLIENQLGRELPYIRRYLPVE